MNSLKCKNMMGSYAGFRGTGTVTAIASYLPPEVAAEVPGRLLGQILNAISASYHAGKKEGMEIADDCLVRKDGSLIPLEAIAKIAISDQPGISKLEPWDGDVPPGNYWGGLVRADGSYIPAHEAQHIYDSRRNLEPLSPSGIFVRRKTDGRRTYSLDWYELY